MPLTTYSDLQHQLRLTRALVQQTREALGQFLAMAEDAYGRTAIREMEAAAEGVFQALDAVHSPGHPGSTSEGGALLEVESAVWQYEAHLDELELLRRQERDVGTTHQ
jgi:hypothetical protein